MTRPPRGAAAGVEGKSGILAYNVRHENAIIQQVGCRSRSRHGHAADGGYDHLRTGDGIATGEEDPSLRTQGIVPCRPCGWQGRRMDARAFRRRPCRAVARGRAEVPQARPQPVRRGEAVFVRIRRQRAWQAVRSFGGQGAGPALGDRPRHQDRRPEASSARPCQALAAQCRGRAVAARRDARPLPGIRRSGLPAP